MLFHPIRHLLRNFPLLFLLLLLFQLGQFFFQVINHLLGFVILLLLVLQHFLALGFRGCEILLEFFHFFDEKCLLSQHLGAPSLRIVSLFLGFRQSVLSLFQLFLIGLAQCLPGIGHTHTALVFRIVVVGDKGCLRSGFPDDGHGVHRWDEL